MLLLVAVALLAGPLPRNLRGEPPGPSRRAGPVLAWASDDHLLIASNGLLARFDLNSSKEELLDDTVIAFALHPQGKHLAVATPEEVSLRSYPAFEWLAALPLHEHGAAAVDTVQALAWSSGGETLAGGTASGHVLLWDVETGEPESGAPESGELWADLEVSPAAAVTQLSFSSDGKRLLSVFEDARAVLWDLEKREEIQRFAPASAEASLDAASFGRAQDRRDKSAGRPASAEDTPPTEAGAMLLSPDGRRLLHTWVRGELATPAAGLAEMSLLDDAGRVLWRRAGVGVEFTPDGAAVLALAPPYRVAALYRVENAAALRVFEPSEGVERLLAVRLNPSGTRLAGVTESRLGQGLVVWDVPTGRILKTRH